MLGGSHTGESVTVMPGDLPEDKGVCADEGVEAGCCLLLVSWLA